MSNYNTYPNPTSEQTNLVKKLYELQDRVMKSNSQQELINIVDEIIEYTTNIPTATINMHDGRVVNSNVANLNIISVLKYDPYVYSHMQDAIEGMILTIDLLIGTYILDVRKRPERDI